VESADAVFCDIEEQTFNINPQRLESLVTEKTTAILPVHVFGNPATWTKYSASPTGTA
jgi:dTDP-4-amino-4,6-dideoxygalactose transaminase